MHKDCQQSAQPVHEQKGANMFASRRCFLLITLAMVLAAVTMLGVCAEGLQAEIIPIGPLPNSVNFEYSLESDKSLYQLGETVHATHTITNPFDVPVGLDLNCSPGFNLLVKQGDIEVYAAHNAFLAVMQTLMFQAGETLELDYTWDVMDNYGNPVLPGEYELVGVVHDVGIGTYASSTIITIVPEPGTLGLLLLGGLGLLRRRRHR